MAPPDISYERVRDIFQAMRSEKINGVPLSDLVGGGDPEVVAAEIVAALAKHVDLGAVRSILDVGGGCGRIATALTQHLSAMSHYVGVDIVPSLVEFGRKFVSARYPQFEFLLLEESNFTYDAWRPKGSVADLTRVSDARPRDSVDLAMSVSLFTHLDYASAVQILSAIGGMLTKGGQAFVTVFVLDSEVKARIRAGQTVFQFPHRTPSGELFAEKIEDPTYAVGYSIEKLEGLVRSADLQREHWMRGYWSQSSPREIFQDALVLRKT
ncbi:MAG: class I SAM-dependent methyltransferase [Chthoniobacterales bacterium]